MLKKQQLTKCSSEKATFFSNTFSQTVLVTKWCNTHPQTSTLLITHFWFVIIFCSSDSILFLCFVFRSNFVLVFRVNLFMVSFCLHLSLTWSNQGPGADGVHVAAHVYGPDFCKRCIVYLFPSIRWIFSGTGLCSRRGSLSWVFHHWGRLNGNRALFQTESLEGLSLGGGRGCHLLAADGKILDLILAKGKKRIVVTYMEKNKKTKCTIFFCLSQCFQWQINSST